MEIVLAVNLPQLHEGMIFLLKLLPLMACREMWRLVSLFNLYPLYFFIIAYQSVE